MDLTEDQLSELETMLNELKSQLEQDVLEAKKGSQPVTLDQQAFGRVSRIDAIQQQQMQAAAVRRMEQRLGMVKTALGRLHTDEFGYCTVCEEPIAIERLRVRPESPLCLGCAKSK